MVLTDNYLNIPDILVYEVFGDPILLYVFGLIILLFISLKYAIPIQAGIALCVMYTMVFFAIFPTTWFKAMYIIVIFFTGMIVWWWASNMMK